MGGANIPIVHYFDHSYLEEEKSMILSFTVIFGAKYLTGMVTSVPPYETFSLIKINILHQSKNYKNHFENSNFWSIWPLSHVGHVTYSFINMLFISTGIFDDKLCPQILSVGTTANSPLSNYISNVHQLGLQNVIWADKILICADKTLSVSTIRHLVIFFNALKVK